MILIRVVTVAFVVTTWLVAAAATAVADPAGPTNYLSEFVDVEPPTSEFEAEIVGGDSFVRLVVDSRSRVDVVGYGGEPYLRFLPDGRVLENELAPTSYVNQDRYAIVEVPPEASASAEPIWREVATGGSFAWHDHRAHWMNEAPPPGGQPGDQILEAVIPIAIDGGDVDLTVVSVWQPAPSRLPVIAGVLMGVLVALGLARRASRKVLAGSIAVLALGATVIALIAFFSVPAETGPPWMLWLVPLTSLTLALIVRWPPRAGRWGEWVGRVSSTLLVIAAVELAVWAMVRWDWMWMAILPTNAPFWIDRLVTALVLIGGVTAAARGLSASFPARSAAD